MPKFTPVDGATAAVLSKGGIRVATPCGRNTEPFMAEDAGGAISKGEKSCSKNP
ncbi:MAG: hypothetical protein M1304_05775 [Candidatus Thermoplasmatota archaeon]|nr:hypothetical protein [Candidatus Thermoplasmatota archaeon]MCL5732102.1 hypothetical protein [Candidatus Thermoplasmatota archaeon]